MSQAAGIVATTASLSATATDPALRSLNPVDGLFLRAEHLRQIEDYARALARAGAVALGTGVAYGYGLSLTGTDGDTLTVGPGLAIDPVGRPLSSRTSVALDLKGLDLPSGLFWLVEVAAADPQPDGNEPVYGELCADPCSAGGSIQPWLLDTVRAQVTPDDGLPAVATERNRLASAYFERERHAGGPWLTPGENRPVSRLVDLPWQGPVPVDLASPGTAVPLGVLLNVGDAKKPTWVVDVWTARRDLVSAPARSGWEAHLGWRPWEVFLAQVLQFQAQLAATPEAVDVNGPQTATAVEELHEELLRNPRRSRQGINEVFAAWLAEHQSAATAGSLASRGFTELPPAGFLSVPATDVSLENALGTYFDPVPVTVRRCSADTALRAVGEAQHLDRIPLMPPSAEGNPAVEVWIPDIPADLPALVPSPSTYGWMAFTRYRERCVIHRPPGPDAVAVYAVTMNPDSKDFASRAAEAAQAASGQALGTLDYPAGTWAVPSAHPTWAQLQSAYDGYAEEAKAGALTGVVGTWSAAGRRSLALVRAELLAQELVAPRVPVAGVHAAAVPLPGEPESIWLVFDHPPQDVEVPAAAAVVP